MNREIKVVIEELGAEFTTTSPFAAFAFLTATEHYSKETNFAEEIAKLCHGVYVSIDSPVDGVDVIDYICENYFDLPDDFNDLCDAVYNGVSQYNL